MSRESAISKEEREAGELLSAAALASFRLNGRFLELAERMALPAGLTAAWWQVLGAILDEPLPVAGIARAMGITRQSVQRIADLLVGEGLAEYRPNPAHRRAKLLAPTPEGLAAVHRINPAHKGSAERLAKDVGTARLRADVESLERLNTAVEALLADSGERQSHPRRAGRDARPGTGSRLR